MSEYFEKYRNVTSVVTFLPLGSAPRIKNNKIEVTKNTRFDEIFSFIRTACNHPDVHIYVNNQFEPTEDQSVVDIARCCGKQQGDNLIALNIHYSLGRAYV